MRDDAGGDLHHDRAGGVHGDQRQKVFDRIRGHLRDNLPGGVLRGGERSQPLPARALLRARHPSAIRYPAHEVQTGPNHNVRPRRQGKVRGHPEGGVPEGSGLAMQFRSA